MNDIALQERLAPHAPPAAEPPGGSLDVL